jgi:tol-pal system protein YbgF
VAADETAVYGDSFAALKAGRYEEAARGFRLYLTKYPQGPRADNATYWLGEAQYVQKDYEAALKSFVSVLESFPDSRKAGDALLKVGYCQYELKAFRNARATLENVSKAYPGTEVARLAEQRLAKMDVEGR